MHNHEIAVVGTNALAKIHVNLLEQFPHLSIRLVEDDIAHEEADALLLTEATTNQVELILSAISAGKHVFAYPFLTIDELTKLTTLGSEYLNKLQVGFKRRFDPDFMQIKSQIAAGEIGEIHKVKITNRDTKPIDTDFDLHDFDMARYITGQEVAEVFAMQTNIADIKTAVITLKMVNGSFVIIDTSHGANYGYDQRLEVFGGKGALLVDNVTHTNTKHFTEKGVISEKPMSGKMERYLQAYQVQLQAFIQNLSQSADLVLPSVHDALAAMQILKAVKDSIQENRLITLKKNS